jgi:hypothetical protein
MEREMDEKSINAIIEQVLSRMGKPTLLVLTPANGYRSETAHRLGQWSGIRWNIVASNQTETELVEVLHLGKQVSWDGKNPEIWLDTYEQVIFPFLDFSTLSEASHGLHLTSAGQLLQYALMKGIPTYAVNYQCHPNSELNQLLGLANNPAMNKRAEDQLVTLAGLGCVVGSLPEIETAIFDVPNKEMRTTKVVTEQSTSLGYITLNEVKNKGVEKFTLQDNLTDLAAEYLKQQL